MSEVVLDTKLAIFAALKLAFTGTRTLVAWADPGADATRRSVWFGDSVEPEIEPAAMVAGRRKPSNLVAEITVRALCAESGDPIHAERGVYGMRARIESAVLDGFDPATVPGLIDARPIRALVTNGEHATLGTAAQCDFTIRVRARIQS
ncbi:MAG: hypothetical protein ABIQ18_39835 [Umezawaea sp.]